MKLRTELEFMRNPLFSIILLFSCSSANSADVFVEAESFREKGGWVVDQQFMDQMGSPYLMAHGLGIPVKDAFTTIRMPETGLYNIYVRTFNWVAPWYKDEGPGKFNLIVNGENTGVLLGSTGSEWMWKFAGKIKITNKEIEIRLHDLTGFNGRVDAIYFTMGSKFPPGDIKRLTRFRNEKLKQSSNTENAGHFDFVVVGGGVAGITAAISSARLGLKVALIHDRPVLGGNNSSEVRVHLGGRIEVGPYPALGDVVNEIGPTQGGNAQPSVYYEDDKKMNMLLAEKNISLFTNYRAFEVKMKNNKIERVLARNIENSKVLVFSAPLFADCTGDGNIGYLSGADYLMGRESKSDFNEPSALDQPDKVVMGSSVQWYSVPSDSSVTFPEFFYGLQFTEQNSEKVTKGEWTWETGMNFDQVKDFERIRDYGMLVVFSNWSFLKNQSVDKDKYKNRRLDWVAYVAGKRESRRLLGDFILKEQDLTDHILYPDASVTTSWTIDLHYPDSINTTYFPNKEFKSIAVQKPIYLYPIPYRCLYSRNVDNLFMAGRDISVTHIALGTIRVMRTTGMMGEVIGMAASLAIKFSTSPRGVYIDHLDKLKSLMTKGVGKNNMENQQDYNLGETLGRLILK